MSRNRDIWFPGIEEDEDFDTDSGSLSLYESYQYRAPYKRQDEESDKLHTALRVILVILFIIIFLYVLYYLVYRRCPWQASKCGKSKCTKKKCGKTCTKKKKCCNSQCANKYVLPFVDNDFFVFNEESPQIWARLCECCDEKKSDCKFQFLVLQDDREDKSVPVDVPNLAEHVLIYDCSTEEWSVSDISDPCQQLLNCVGPDPPIPG